MSCTAQENFDDLELPVWEQPHTATRTGSTRKFRNWLRECKERLEFELASFMIDLAGQCDPSS